MQNQRHTPIVSAILSDLRRGWRFFVPLFLVCVLIMYALLSALTDAAGRAYQKKQLSEHLGLDTAQLLHLEYWKNDETPEFADALARFHAHLSGLEGVLRVGQFDATGAYFEELRSVEAYQTRNAAFVKGSRYETVPGIARILRIDESLLPLFEIGISEYPRLESGRLPLYASDAFRTLLPLGTQLTETRTGDVYEIAGYLAEDAMWANENDLIRLPLDSLEGRFIMPWSERSRDDFLFQLSALHNTYLLLSEAADADAIKEEIHAYSLQNGFEAVAYTLAEEFAAYDAETKEAAHSALLLAASLALLELLLLAVSFIIRARRARKNSIETRATLAAAEMTALTLPSTLLAWGIRQLQLTRSPSLFQSVQLAANIRCLLPASLAFALLPLLIAAAMRLPLGKGRE